MLADLPPNWTTFLVACVGAAAALFSWLNARSSKNEIRAHRSIAAGDVAQAAQKAEAIAAGVVSVADQVGAPVAEATRDAANGTALPPPASGPPATPNLPAQKPPSGPAPDAAPPASGPAA